jgi:hypothetical protein
MTIPRDTPFGPVDAIDGGPSTHALVIGLTAFIVAAALCVAFIGGYLVALWVVRP